MELMTPEQTKELLDYTALINRIFVARMQEGWRQYDIEQHKQHLGELCFIRWPYITLGEMNDKAAFYAERDEWNASVVGASD